MKSLSESELLLRAALIRLFAHANLLCSMGVGTRSAVDPSLSLRSTVAGTWAGVGFCLLLDAVAGEAVDNSEGSSLSADSSAAGFGTFGDTVGSARPEMKDLYKMVSVWPLSGCGSEIRVVSS